MDAEEFHKWMAFEMLQDDEFKERIEKDIKAEKDAKMTEEQTAQAIKDFFKQIGK